jgi:hypothetical protein
MLLFINAALLSMSYTISVKKTSLPSGIQPQRRAMIPTSTPTLPAWRWSFAAVGHVLAVNISFTVHLKTKTL